MPLHPKYIRFIRYSLVGCSTLLLDLGLLFFFIDTLKWPSVFAAAVSFFVAVSLNYSISRAWIFRGSEKPELSRMSGFLLISLVGLGIVSGGMYIFNSLLEIHYLVSRLLVASLTGFWNYLINLYINFRVAGKKL